MEIAGDYQLAGAIDLHARFVGYNWYTLMFREGYDRIGNALTNWKNDGFAIHAPHVPEQFNPLMAAVDGVAHTGRYLAKSFIKANMYMNPAVVPFWVLRASQSKWRGEKFIELNELGTAMHRGSKTNALKTQEQVNDINTARVANGEPGDEVKLHSYSWDNYKDYPKNANGKDTLETRFSKGMNAIGAVQDSIGRKAGQGAEWLGTRSWLSRFTPFSLITFEGRLRNPHASESELLSKGLKSLGHEYSDAAISYTPYMYAKQEFGLRVDDSKGDGKPGQMDKAIYRFMDNVAAFNMPATWKSVKEMWTLGIHFEQDAPVREGGAVEVAQQPKSIRTQTFADNAEKPSTTVTAGDVTHEPANLTRREGDAKTADEDKSWAQSVMGGAVNPAQIMSAGATRH
jgi:hypothetical protein